MLVTPFDDSGALVWDDLGPLTAHVVSAQVDGIAILGLAGEAFRLSIPERQAVAEVVASALPPTVPLIVGCTAGDVEGTLQLVEHAVGCGAAAVMVAQPAGRAIGDDALFRYFQVIATAAAPAALVIQDAPGFVDGTPLAPEMLLQLIDTCPNLQYIKSERIPPVPVTAELASIVGRRVGIFGGNGGLYFLDVLAAGATGLIPGAELAAVWKALYDRYRTGAVSAASALFRDVLPLLVFENQTLDIFIASNKEILRRQGVLRHASLRGIANPLRLRTREIFWQHAEPCLEIEAGLRSTAH